MALVEILIAMAIMAGIAAVMGASLPGLTRAGQAAALESKLEAFIRKAGFLAKQTQTPIRLVLDNNALVFAGNHQRRLKLDGLSGQVSMVSGIEVASGGRGTIVFMPDGTTSGARLYLPQAGKPRFINIHWLNGAISWHEG